MYKMEEKRELLFQEICKLQELLSDQEEKQQRLMLYHPKKGNHLSAQILSTQNKLYILRKQLKVLDDQLGDPQLTTIEQKQEDPLKPLLHVFAKGEALVQTKRSYLSILIGRHPQVELATLIEEAKIEAKKIDTDCLELKKLLERFIHEAEDPWNKALYRGQFLVYYTKLLKIMSEKAIKL